MDVSFYATLRDITGTKRISFDLPESATVRTLLDAIGDAYPAIAALIWQPDGSLSDYIKVFVDGRESRHLQGLETPVLPTSTASSANSPRAASLRASSMPTSASKAPSSIGYVETQVRSKGLARPMCGKESVLQTHPCLDSER